MVEFCNNMIWPWNFFMDDRILITDSISLGVLGLFKLFIWFWINFCRWYIFKKIIIESFVYNSLSWHLTLGRLWRTAIQAILTLRFSIEKSRVILIDLLFFLMFLGLYLLQLLMFSPNFVYVVCWLLWIIANFSSGLTYLVSCTWQASSTLE